MTDMLARRRLNDNLIDRLEGVRRQSARSERRVVEADDGGRVAVLGLLLTVLDAPAAPPPAGQVLLYAIEVAGTIELRAADATGTVKTLEVWI